VHHEPDPADAFATRVDRGTRAFFVALALGMLVFGVVLSAGDERLVDRVGAPLALVAVHWPQLAALWWLYARRRRQQLREAAVSPRRAAGRRRRGAA
jgi:hypothetical protein